MKIALIAYDHDFKLGKERGDINGGTAWLWHLCHNFQELGHEAVMIENATPIPEADLYIIQSEWYGTHSQPERCEEMRKQGSKLVVILGHFKGGVYFDPNKIEADLFVSTWKGEVVDNFKEEVKFFPHAYCDICDKEGELRKGDTVWVGNKYPLRNEHYFEGLHITRVNGLLPSELGQLYRGSKICPNIHGEFQKGKVSKEPSTLADVPGFAVNERLFQIAGAGGFQIADDNPQIREFYDKDEVICVKNGTELGEKMEEFIKDPGKRWDYIEKAKKKTLAKHTYRHRCKQLLEWLK